MCSVVLFYTSLFAIMPFLSLSLYCLSFFDLRLLFILWDLQTFLYDMENKYMIP